MACRRAACWTDSSELNCKVLTSIKAFSRLYSSLMTSRNSCDDPLDSCKAWIRPLIKMMPLTKSPAENPNAPAIDTTAYSHSLNLVNCCERGKLTDFLLSGANSASTGKAGSISRVWVAVHRMHWWEHGEGRALTLHPKSQTLNFFPVLIVQRRSWNSLALSPLLIRWLILQLECQSQRTMLSQHSPHLKDNLGT